MEYWVISKDSDMYLNQYFLINFNTFFKRKLFLSIYVFFPKNWVFSVFFCSLTSLQIWKVIFYSIISSHWGRDICQNRFWLIYERDTILHLYMIWWNLLLFLIWKLSFAAPLSRLKISNISSKLANVPPSLIVISTYQLIIYLLTFFSREKLESNSVFILVSSI